MILMVILAILIVIALVLYAIFRFWAARAPVEWPGAVAGLLGIGGVIGSLILGSPRPRPRPTTLAGHFGEATGGQIADALTRALMMAGLVATAILVTGMVLGIVAGARLREKRGQE